MLTQKELDDDLEAILLNVRSTLDTFDQFIRSQIIMSPEKFLQSLNDSMWDIHIPIPKDQALDILTTHWNEYLYYLRIEFLTPDQAKDKLLNNFREGFKKSITPERHQELNKLCSEIKSVMKTDTSIVH